MRTFAWWPVTLILLAAPLVTWGWGWVDKQRVLAAHSRQIGDLQQQAAKDAKAAYGLGKRDGAAEVRDSERIELEATKAELARMEAELETERAKAEEVPPVPTAKVTPVPIVSPEIAALCKRSASCRERRNLK